MAIGRHGQEAFIILPYVVWRGSRLQSPFEFDHNSVCPGNADGGCCFLLLWIGAPSCLFAEVGHGFSIHFLLTARLRAKAVALNHSKQHHTLSAE